jgi:hypothetical protein
MYATEFETVINEPYIKIPNYEAFKGHNVRVVLVNIDEDIEFVNDLEKEDILKSLSEISKEDNEIDELATTIVEI